MALSKAETRQAILSLSKELGVEAPANLEQIDKLDLLQPILEALQAKKADADEADKGSDGDGAGADGGGNVGGPGGPPPPPTDVAPPAPKTKLVATTYVVAEGRAVTTLRGQIGALEHVWPRDFNGGQKDLDYWVTHGAVTKTEHFE